MDKKTKMKEKKASGIWKKVLGICLAVIMVIGMTMPAWAQIYAESKGSIKVTADESGNRVDLPQPEGPIKAVTSLASKIGRAHV